MDALECRSTRVLQLEVGELVLHLDLRQDRQEVGDALLEVRRCWSVCVYYQQKQRSTNKLTLSMGTNIAQSDHFFKKMYTKRDQQTSSTLSKTCNRGIVKKCDRLPDHTSINCVTHDMSVERNVRGEGKSEKISRVAK